jgi:hypothetical protein
MMSMLNLSAVLIEQIHVGFRDHCHPTYSRAFRWMSLLRLSCVAYKPTFVAEYHVWEESRSEHEMGMNYACG